MIAHLAPTLGLYKQGPARLSRLPKFPWHVFECFRACAGNSLVNNEACVFKSMHQTQYVFGIQQATLLEPHPMCFDFRPCWQTCLLLFLYYIDRTGVLASGDVLFICAIPQEPLFLKFLLKFKLHKLFGSRLNKVCCN